MFARIKFVSVTRFERPFELQKQLLSLGFNSFQSFKSTHFQKLYFQSFLRYFSLQIIVDLSNTTYPFIAIKKVGKRACL